MSLYKTIMTIRVELQNKELKKSGKNKFAGFSYFELKDFLPTLNELMLKYEVCDHFTIEDNYARLILSNETEMKEYKIPFERFETPLNKQGKPSMQDIQYLGALNTYYKRYLYLNAFGITDGEIIDSMNNNDLSSKQAKATKNQLEILTQLMTDNLSRGQELLNYYKVDDIEKLNAQQASEAIGILRKKKK